MGIPSSRKKGWVRAAGYPVESYTILDPAVTSTGEAGTSLEKKDPDPDPAPGAGAGRPPIDPIDLYDRMGDVTAGRDVKLFPQQLDLVKRLQAKIDLLREKNRGKIGARLEAIGSWACSVLGHSELSGASFERTILESHEAQQFRIDELEQALRAQKCTCNSSSRDLLLEICTPEEIAATGGLPPVMVCDRCKALSGVNFPSETDLKTAPVLIHTCGNFASVDKARPTGFSCSKCGMVEFSTLTQSTDPARPLHAEPGIMDDLLIQTQRMRKSNQELRLLGLVEEKLIERKRHAYTECRDLCSGTLRAKMDKLIATLPPKE